MQNNINSEEIRKLCVPLPPPEVQRKIVERVTAARAEIAHERAAAAALRLSIAAEVESLILGGKALSTRKPRLRNSFRIPLQKSSFSGSKH